MIECKVDGKKSELILTMPNDAEVADSLSEVVMIATAVIDRLADDADTKLNLYGALASCFSNPIMQLTMLGSIEEKEEL